MVSLVFIDQSKYSPRENNFLVLLWWVRANRSPGGRTVSKGSRVPSFRGISWVFERVHTIVLGDNMRRDTESRVDASFLERDGRARISGYQTDTVLLR